jgi:hypothetical protein
MPQAADVSGPQNAPPLGSIAGRSAPSAIGAANKNLVLAAMVFAVAMTFIDQTIVAIAIPNIQKQLSLSASARNGSSTATCCRSRHCSRSAGSSATSSDADGWSSSA